jgi:hypothetical protein
MTIIVQWREWIPSSRPKDSIRNTSNSTRGRLRLHRGGATSCVTTDGIQVMVNDQRIVAQCNIAIAQGSSDIAAHHRHWHSHQLAYTCALYPIGPNRDPIRPVVHECMTCILSYWKCEARVAEDSTFFVLLGVLSLKGYRSNRCFL